MIKFNPERVFIINLQEKRKITSRNQKKIIIKSKFA